MGAENSFTFKISLSVLNHLGRNLYRSFATVIGEAIFNAWDADANNVWIYLDPNRSDFWIKDDGSGMSSDDFQNKFLKIGRCDDPFVAAMEKAFVKDAGRHEMKTLKLAGATGFIASVKLPRDLKIMTTDGRVGIDLFVNGRLRERDMLKHIPTARIVENYLYGRIHFDGLDDNADRFTSSREGIAADDAKLIAPLLVKTIHPEVILNGE